MAGTQQVAKQNATAASNIIARGVAEGLDPLTNQDATAASNIIARGVAKGLDPLTNPKIIEARKKLQGAALLNLMIWKGSVDSEIAIAPFPEDSSSAWPFWVALAGNVIWASTCLLSPELVIVKVMSFGGAAIGSGILNPSGATGRALEAEGREMVRKSVAKKFDELKGDLEKQSLVWVDGSPEVSAALLSLGTHEVAGLAEFTWPFQFSIPFANGSQLIGDLARANIQKALAAYKNQWNLWKQKAWQYKIKRGDVFPPSDGELAVPQVYQSLPTQYYSRARKPGRQAIAIGYRWAATTTSRKDDIYAINGTEHKAIAAGAYGAYFWLHPYMPLLFGVLALLRVLGDSHSQAFRSLDMVRLIGVGFCWGIAFAGLLWLIAAKVRK